jgi:hypothetical protein
VLAYVVPTDWVPFTFAPSLVTLTPFERLGRLGWDFECRVSRIVLSPILPSARVPSSCRDRMGSWMYNTVLYAQNRQRVSPFAARRRRSMMAFGFPIPGTVSSCATPALPVFQTRCLLSFWLPRTLHLPFIAYRLAIDDRVAPIPTVSMLAAHPPDHNLWG